MWYGTDTVSSHLESLLYKLITTLVCIHALLWKSHNLQIQNILYLISHLKSCLKPCKCRVCDINMCPDCLHTIQHLFPDTTIYAILHLLHCHMSL